ncbi:helix-turn-helix domain-containing protein [Streptomyces sp. NPDC050095]|uniref:helix-turn-helix domain-containing protein n=1 Tax=unclassified Streptomyces TaxID=2593676 RepID=UPI0034306B5E
MSEVHWDVDRLDILILRLLHDGHTEAAIARMATLSYRTVQRRIQRMKEEFGVTSRFALGATAERKGLLDHPDEEVDKVSRTEKPE